MGNNKKKRELKDMENDSINKEKQETTTSQKTISNAKKMTIINLMFVKKQGATLAVNRDNIKAFPTITQEEKDFTDKVYDILQELNIGEDILERGDIEQLKEQLYQRCRIPQEVVEKMKQDRMQKAKEAQADIMKNYEEWAKQDAQTEKRCEERGGVSGQEPSIQVIEGGYSEEVVRYKEDLYQPGFLCGHAEKMPEKPFIQHVRYTTERATNTSPETPYQFADRIYAIRKIGELVYMPTPNLKDSLSEYEITISKGNMSRTVKRFGEISFHRMREPAYSTAVLLQLLSVDNLTDKELHGYIGGVEQVRDRNGKTKDEYQIVHLPEEYTAVVIWEEIEQERRKQEQSKIEPEPRRALGGEDR